MKNKRLFKNLTASALTLTSVLAFSSTAFADPVQFSPILSSDGVPSGEEGATIENTLNTERTLTFKKVFTGGSFKSWTERTTEDAKLLKFTANQTEAKDYNSSKIDVTDFDNIFTMYRNNTKMSEITPNKGKRVTIGSTVTGSNDYTVQLMKIDDVTDTSGNATTTITYQIKIDNEDASGQPYTFSIGEKADATKDYSSSNKDN